MVETLASIDVPSAWEQLPLAEWRGVLLVIGAPDVGKSTFARYLYSRLSDLGRRVAYLDGDPGQSTLGPPATLTLALGLPGDASFPPKGRLWRKFVGAVSPRGHMLPLLVGAARLVCAAQEAGADVIVYDTSGLVDPLQGGVNLKLAKIDLLRPTVILAIERANELRPILMPLHYSRRVPVVKLASSPAAIARDVPTRQAHRAAQFARYFAGARPLALDCRRLAIFPTPDFALNQLVALEDAQGFALGLGIVRYAELHIGHVTLLTPLSSLEGVDALHLGDLTVDPHTYRDQRLP